MKRKYKPNNWIYGMCAFCGQDWFEVEDAVPVCPSFKYGSILKCRNCGARFSVCVINGPKRNIDN